VLEEEYPISFLDYCKLYPNIIYGMIIKGRKNLLQKIVNRLQIVKSAEKKGKLFELLVRNIFKSFYLIEFKRGIANRYSTGQIDIYFKVKRMECTIFFEFSDLLIIECKNWKKNVTAKEIRDFAGKMKDNKCRVGIMFAKTGVTGDFKSKFPKDGMGAIRRVWDQGEGLILVFTLRDALGVLSGENVYNLLEDKYYFFKTI
jgi:hypothetical protein